MTKVPKDVGASVRARLLQLAKKQGEDFQLVLTRYASERLLYRLAQSSHATSFVLKGAALFMLWTEKPHRATRDLDLLGYGDPSIDRIRAVVSDLISVKVDDDGLKFDPSTLEVDPIREDQEYGGIRAVVVAVFRRRRHPPTPSTSRSRHCSIFRLRTFARTREKRWSPRNSRPSSSSDSRTVG